MNDYIKEEKAVNVNYNSFTEKDMDGSNMAELMVSNGSGLTIGGGYVYNGTQTNTNLYKKLALVMAEVDWIDKGSQVMNASGKPMYDYTTEAQFISALRPLFVEYGLLIYPVSTLVTDMRQMPNGNAIMTTISVTYKIVDSDSGQEVIISGLGQGTDTGDKGLYKALTGAFKYALRQAFFIGTGQDPEATDEVGNSVSVQKPSAAKTASKTLEAGNNPPPASAAEVGVKIDPATMRNTLRSLFNGLPEQRKLEVTRALGDKNIEISNLPDDQATLRSVRTLIYAARSDAEFGPAVKRFLL